MRSRSSRALAAILLGGLLAFGCANSVTRADDDEPRLVVAEDGGEEEVLDPDDADFTMDEDDAEHEPETKAGQMLVVFGAILSTLAAAALPYLMFL